MEVEPAPVDARPLAAIDIGTNSFHLLVARPLANRRFEVLDRDKEVVRLGSGSGDMKRLSPDAVERGVTALARFRLIADAAGAEIVAVATSAVREAGNRDEFLRRAERDAGVHVEVVSGVEEARLIHLGVLQAVPVFDRRHLVVDIGGGSTELIIGEGEHVLEAFSLKLGAIRLTERFGLAAGATPKAVRECRRYVASYLANFVRVATRVGFEVTVGSSGTIVNLMEMARARQGEVSLAQVSGAVLRAEDLRAVVASLAEAATVADRLALPGIESRRADILLGGAVVIEQLVELLGIKEIVVSDAALREGILLEALRRRDGAGAGHLADLRADSVTHLAAIAPGEADHSAHAAGLALSLFEQTQHRHHLGAEAEEILEAAGLLANVGLFVSHAKHHLHSYYIIRNSDLLAGFTDHEVELIALVARYHRKSAPKPSHEAFAGLSEEDQRLVRTLAGILRIGIALDRTRLSTVVAVEVEDTGDALLLHLVADGDTSLERYTAGARSSLLAETLGVPVKLAPEDRSAAEHLAGRPARHPVGGGAP